MADKCVICKAPATKKVIWADGRAYQPSCDKHVRDTQMMLTRKNGKMTELAGVKDLTSPVTGGTTTTIDLVASAVYPGLERVPGKQNWVDYAGGLPKYIERIAKHLHYERGYSISRAIAVAVNTVKRWARMGKVAKYGDPNNKHVTAKTAALAAAAVAEWEAKKKAGKLALSDPGWYIIDMTEVSEESALDLAMEVQSVDLARYDLMGTGVDSMVHAILASVNINDLAQRANATEDPTARGHARQAVLDLAVPRSELTAEKRKQRASNGQAMEDGSFPIFDRTSLQSAIRLARTPQQRAHVMKRARALGLASVIPESWVTNLTDTLGVLVLDLASTIAPRNARGRASDGRRSYRGQGKWKHGYVPVNQAAKESKAKGSPIAIKRLTRLFGGNRRPDDPPTSSVQTRPRVAKTRSGATVQVRDKGEHTSEGANRLGALRNTKFEDSRETKHSSPANRLEESKQQRTTRRAEQPWDEIPQHLKTVRNGKRYVLATFGGEQVITEWQGNVDESEQSPLNKRKRIVSITAADAANLAPAELRQLLSNPNIPKSVRKVLNRALRAKTPEGAKK